jgi:hypothetical protein
MHAGVLLRQPRRAAATHVAVAVVVVAIIP